MSRRTTVLVLAKEPLPGRVKTRLCPPLMPDEAAEVAAAAIADSLEAVLATPADRHLLALDGCPGPWLPEGIEVVPQVGQAFADRLRAAWSCVDGPCVQIGMDTPQITPELLTDALHRVAEPRAAALGRATDGGWWALALHEQLPTAFDGVPMSTSETAEAQLSVLAAHGLTIDLLPELTDIDTFADAVAVGIEIPGSRTGRTVARLRSTLDVHGAHR